MYGKKRTTHVKNSSDTRTKPLTCLLDKSFDEHCSPRFAMFNNVLELNIMWTSQYIYIYTIHFFSNNFNTRELHLSSLYLSHLISNSIHKKSLDAPTFTQRINNIHKFKSRLLQSGVAPPNPIPILWIGSRSQNWESAMVKAVGSCESHTFTQSFKC